MSRFEIRDKFYLDGKPFKVISGSIHYFRTVPEYWQDRLEKLINIGCNTVETYIPWNFHETEKGNFNWNGMHDICRFIELADKLGLYMIIRPSPYICSEWEFGGLPAWLLKDRSMRLRCSYKPHLNAVDSYYSVLMPKLAPYQIDNGGNIIMMQIENEYGYYGNDTSYLEFLRDTMRKYGITVPFVTSDGPWSEFVFKSGMVDGALPTGNFGSSAEWQFGEMRRFIGEDKPLMCMEFWNGWFDVWGEEHNITAPEKAAQELDILLKNGSMNFYMFEGGTNFGFMSGKNNEKKTGIVTSYDYDAPLTEDGRITEKYEKCKEVISRYTDINEVPLTTQIRRLEYGEIRCTAKTDLFSTLDSISDPIKSVYPLSFEELDSYYGYVLYRLHIRENETVSTVRCENAADRVQGFRNGKYAFTAFDETIDEQFELAEKSAGVPPAAGAAALSAAGTPAVSEPAVLRSVFRLLGRPEPGSGSAALYLHVLYELSPAAGRRRRAEPEPVSVDVPPHAAARQHPRQDLPDLSAVPAVLWPVRRMQLCVSESLRLFHL